MGVGGVNRASGSGGVIRVNETEPGSGDEMDVTRQPVDQDHGKGGGRQEGEEEPRSDGVTISPDAEARDAIRRAVHPDDEEGPYSTLPDSPSAYGPDGLPIKEK